MKLALINDTHAGARGDNVQVNDFFFRFWDNIFFPALEKHGVDRVVHLGDVVDRRKFINFAIWNRWKTDFFDRLTNEMNIPIDLLTGNHDCYYRNTNKINALDELLHKHPHVRVFSEPQDMQYGSLLCALVPWINTGNYEESMSYLATTKAPVILGHLEITGFEMDQGNVCLSGMSKATFDRFDMVLSGHFHHKSSDGNIHYLGNQVEITWADYKDPRGFHILDTETRELTFIENPYRLFHKILYDDSVQNFEFWKRHDFQTYANAYVKVVVTRKQNPYLFDQMLDSLYKVSPLDVTVVEDYTESDLDASQVGVDQAEDTVTIIRKCVDGMTMPGGVDPEILKGRLQELYVEAVNSETAML
jgi:DNA repair exonuclease SbcCD nuclease subunit